MFLTYLVTSLAVPAGQENIVKSIFSKIIPGTLPWVSLYWVFALISLAMVLLISFSVFPEVDRKEDERAGSWELHKSLFRQKTVILYLLEYLLM